MKTEMYLGPEIVTDPFELKMLIQHRELINKIFSIANTKIYDQLLDDLIEYLKGALETPSQCEAPGSIEARSLIARIEDSRKSKHMQNIEY